MTGATATNDAARRAVARRGSRRAPTSSTRGRPVLVARAPGRLDVMGGIADYSGSLVLELPLAVATWVAVQAQDAPDAGHRERATPRRAGAAVQVDGRTHPARGHRPRRAAAVRRGARPPVRAIRERAWAAYVAGALVVLQHEHRAPAAARRSGAGPLRACRSAKASARRRRSRSPRSRRWRRSPASRSTTARSRSLAQKVENLVVGAPCGVMDQMTAACGRRGHLLELLCQPAEVVGHVALPPALELFGVDSGIRHAVSRRRLRQRARRRVHGLPHRRRRRRAGGARRRARPRGHRRSAVRRLPRERHAGRMARATIATPSRRR